MNKNVPFFSIITCTRNSEKFLGDCIESVNSQNTSNYEHILVDGMSEDKTPSILRNYVRKNKRAKLYSLSPKGISNAMNYAIEKSSGKYLIFLHSDDMLRDEDILNKAESFLLKNSHLDWVYGQVQEIDDRGKFVTEPFPRKRVFHRSSPKLLKLYNYIPHQATIFRGNVFQEHGGYSEEYKYCMDYDYFLKVAEKTEWEYMPLTISNYRVHKDSLSSNVNNLKKVDREYLSIQRKHTWLIFHPMLQLIREFLRRK